jgi:DnaJ family protein C protein 8
LSYVSPLIFPQAESELSDKDKREELDAVINQARSLVLKVLTLPISTSDTDPQLKNLNPPFKAQLRAQSKELLIDEEVRRRKYVNSVIIPYPTINIFHRAIKMNLANEGLEARKKDEEVATRKRKVEEDKNWEGS